MLMRALFLQTLPINPLDPTLIAPARLPLAVMAALFVALFYALLRKLLGERVALVSTLLLVLHPFHIAHSRVLHHDALTTMFMVLSLLAMVGYWLQGWKRRWLLVSAVMAGLALLSKPVSWFMIPYAGLLGGLSLYYRWRSGQWRGWFDVWRLMGEGIL
jgi:4-amino-4-deoxy-L-arabinose transferase-like glycosyltransferase